MNLAGQMLRYLNLALVWIFVYIMYGTIQAALGHWAGLGSAFLITTIALIFGVLGYYTWKMRT